MLTSGAGSGRSLTYIVPILDLRPRRGRLGADVARRARRLQCVGTSATFAGKGRYADQTRPVVQVAGQIFGATILGALEAA